MSLLSVMAIAGSLLGGLGMILSRWIKVFALFLATLAAWVVTLFLAYLAAWALKPAVMAALLNGACLQLGYLAGTLVLRPPSASAPRINRDVAKRNDAE